MPAHASQLWKPAIKLPLLILPCLTGFCLWWRPKLRMRSSLLASMGVSHSLKFGVMSALDISRSTSSSLALEKHPVCAVLAHQPQLGCGFLSRQVLPHILPFIWGTLRDTIHMTIWVRCGTSWQDNNRNTLPRREKREPRRLRIVPNARQL